MAGNWELIPGSLSQDQLQYLAQRLGINVSLVRLLDILGFHSLDQAIDFLYPKLAQLEDPFGIANIDRAVDRLYQAILKKESICVMGDYDVDGVTSTVLLISILNQFGCHPRYFVPRRMEEGYGLSQAALDRLLSEGKPSLLFVLDSGTNAHKEVAILRSHAVDVIIVDHHKSKDLIPKDCILVNPHVHQAVHAQSIHMCTVGLVFKLVHALLKHMRKNGHPRAWDIRLRDYLDLTALGTVADLMPLKGENRILVKYGLKRLAKTDFLGLKALCQVSGIVANQELKPVDIAFKLGPRINASGRIADAALPISMLLSKDSSHCMEAAQALDAMNKERQDIEKEITIQAQEQVDLFYKDDFCIVLHNPKWHSGVVGIVAGKLARLYNRPCIVFGQEGDLAKGSGRSVPHVNLVETLGECNDLLESWGGHPMAIGVALHPSFLVDFRKKINLALSKRLTTKDLVSTLRIAAWLDPKDIHFNLLEELDLFQPFGEGNSEPIFGLKNFILNAAPEPFGDNHFRFLLNTVGTQTIYGVAWKKADRMPPRGVPIQMAIKLHWNFWNNRKTIQAELIDWR